MRRADPANPADQAGVAVEVAVQRGGTAAPQARRPLPSGRFGDGHDADLWFPVTTATGAPAAAPAAARPSDGDRVRTTVDRPVAVLRPVGLDEARQLAECFAIEYMSCDEDDPELRQLALADYLTCRVDVFGWPADRPGVGRQRAVHARAGECLVEGRWVTVDVSVLIEVYQRTDPAPHAPDGVDAGDAGDAGEPADFDDPAGAAGPDGHGDRDDPAPPVVSRRPELPLNARRSGVPPAHDPGWAHLMTIRHRLGVPVRRHDSGALVVELSTVPDHDHREVDSP